MGMTTRIYSRSQNANKGHKIDVEDCSNLVWYPEIKYKHGAAAPKPVHPVDQIEMCPELVGKVVVTLSEYIILWFLREIREGNMGPEDLELYCDGQRIRVDSAGELIDRWPDGFFTERADLLFGEA
jgi:hypothetical protein